MGALLHLPHGRANALLLPLVAAFNAGLGEQGEFPARARYASLARLSGCCAYTETVAVQSLVRKIRDLMTETGMPRKLEDTEHRALVSSHLDSLAEAALADRCTGGNPRPVGAGEGAVPEAAVILFSRIHMASGEICIARLHRHRRCWQDTASSAVEIEIWSDFHWRIV